MSEEVRVTDAASGGQKGMKPERMGLLPWDALRVISRASHYGATKYDDPVVGPYNWKRGYAWSLSFDALQRHLAAWWDGEDRDPESGLSHLAHAGWHVLTLIWFSLHRRAYDDRPHTYFRELGPVTGKVLVPWPVAGEPASFRADTPLWAHDAPPSTPHGQGASVDDQADGAGGV